MFSTYNFDLLDVSIKKSKRISADSWNNGIYIINNGFVPIYLYSIGVRMGGAEWAANLIYRPNFFYKHSI